MNDTASYVSQPQVVDLPKLLLDVRAGHIQVPRFQRPFVWEDERRVELLRSLRAGIPIGSLLVWRTSQTRLRCFETIAGVQIPPPAQGHTVSYLLDGHQRLTALFAAFTVRESEDEGKEESLPLFPSPDDEVPAQIFFDLQQDDFVVGNPDEAWSCLPLHLFLDAVALRQHFRNVERAGKVLAPEIDRLQAIAETVLYAMQWCRIPVIPLSTDDVELATRTFHRVNSQGVAMTEFHMIAALSWGDRFDLRATFERAWSEQNLPQNWAPAGEQQTLNVLKGLLGMDLARSSGDLLVRRIKDRQELAVKSVELLAQAMKLVNTHLVHTPVTVPYQMQLTLTAIALHELPENLSIDTEWLRRWWGLTTAWGSFASAATHRVQAALRHLKSGLDGNSQPWPELLHSSTTPAPLPNNLDLRNARARYFADGYAADCGAIALLHERGPRALVSVVAGHGPRLGNRFLWPSEDVAMLNAALGVRDHACLAGHFIDDECLDAWHSENFVEFFKRREFLMNAFEGEWFKKLHPDDFILGF